MATANDIINFAQAEIGTKESPAGSNKVKYNKWYYGKDVSGDAYPWCAAFVSYVFANVDSSLCTKNALCMNMANWFKEKGQWYTSSPQPGDVVFFKFGTSSRWTNHVGIVKSVNLDGTIQTIEGNTSTTSNDNGGCVMERKRSTYVGLGRPAYQQATNSYEYVIDVSSYQTISNYKSVASYGITKAILRSTTKDNTADSKFEQHYKGFTSVGVPCEVYKYSYATTTDESIAEANSVINLLSGRKMKIWLDLENSAQVAKIGKIGITSIANAFINTCEKAGFEVGIYANLNWFKNYIDSTIKNSHDIWVARYPAIDNGTVQERLRPNIGECLWQFSSKGQVPGISGNVDLDVVCKGQQTTKSITKDNDETIVKIITNAINVRSTPDSSISNNKVGVYKLGDLVQVLGQYDNSWYQVSNGYMSSKSAYSEQAIGIVTASTLNIRSGAGTENSITGQLSKGSQCKLIGTNGNWYHISLSDGTKGYVSKNYIVIK